MDSKPCYKINYKNSKEIGNKFYPNKHRIEIGNKLQLK